MNAWILRFTLTALCLIGFCNSQASFIPLRTDITGEQPQIELLHNEADQTQFEIRLPGLIRSEVILEGQTWDRLEIPGGSCGAELGAPEVPHFTRLLIVPSTAGFRAEFEVLETTTIPNIKLMPAQSLNNSSSPVAYDSDVYSRNEDYPSQRVSVGEPAILRGVRVVNLKTNPVQYNPVTRELKVATRYRVTVHYEGADLHNVPARQVPLSKTNADLLNSVSFNSQDLELDQPSAGSYLIICVNDASLLNTLQLLVDWKKRKGHSVTVQTFTPGATYTTIKQLIQNAYNTWSEPPEYVLLFGDVTGSYALPSFPSYQIDHPYTQLDGNDLLPDVALGRLPAETAVEALVLVNKVLTYEKQPFVTTTDWYHQSVLVAAASAMGMPAIFTQREIKAQMLEHDYTRIDTLWYTMGGSAPAAISTAINNGVTYYNDLGYLGLSGLNNSHIDALTNGSKLPFCTLVAEGTGSFASESLMEHFVITGTPVTLRGAIAAIGGATTSQQGRYNNTIASGFYAGIFDEGITAAGHVLIRGKMEMYTAYFAHDQGAVSNYFHWYALAGDPGLDLYNGALQFMTCDLPATTTWGENTLTLTVTETGVGPVEDATVCLFMPGVNEYQSVGVTDEAGQVTLPLTVTSSGNVKFTVTKHNFYPIVDSLDVLQETVAVGYFNHTIDDDELGTSSGDGDGFLNPGETIEIPLTFKNYGNTTTATNVSVAASETDPFAVLADDQETFPDIIPGVTGNSFDDLDLIVNADCPDGHLISLPLQTTCTEGEWDGLLNLEVISWAVELLSAVAVGGDTVLAPGETADFVLTIRNAGHKEAAGLTALLQSLDPLVIVTDSLASFDTVAINARVSCNTNPFTLSSSVNAPPGHEANLAITYSANGAVLTDTITVVLGSQSTVHPQGPDEYGYYCYDDTDLNYPQHPVFDWLEIDPAYGGSGYQLAIIDLGENQDMSRNVPLPFTFRYYGEEVDSITVCSNGWISTRLNASLANAGNYPIPSSQGPGGMIAPFWDDLITWSDGHVFAGYDSANHLCVFEWSRVKNRGSPNPLETFEIILFDPAYHPTPTGDGEIVFQYLQVAEVVGDYDYNPYSTVGVENSEETAGIEVVYWNTYDDPNAAHLQAGRAYKFTTAYSYVSPGTNLSVALTPYGIPILIPPEGGSFNFDIQVFNIAAQAANADVWTMATLPDNSEVGPLLEALGLAVPANSTLSRNRTQAVPASAPAGGYTYHAYLGYYPETIFSEASFPVSKTGVGSQESGVGEWLNTGEDFMEGAQNFMPLQPEAFKIIVHPNPFNPSTVISFELRVPSLVKLEVFDIKGRLAESLVNDWNEAGSHEVTWNAIGMASGLYLYRLEAGQYQSTGKMLLVK